MRLQYQLPAGLADICKLFGVSRQAYYKKQRRLDSVLLHHEIVLQMVERLRADPCWKRTGTDKLHRMLSPEFEKMGMKIGRIQLNDLLREHGCLIRKRRRKAKTTDSSHRFKKYPNLIMGMQIDRPAMVWVSDITYLDLTDRFGYLFLITDAYSRKVIGYNFRLTLDTGGALDALQMAIAQWYNVRKLIHHSDRGTQYCANDYVQYLDKHKIAISMAAKANPYQNAIAERLNGILKEMGLNMTFENFEQAQAQISHTIDIYNNKRLHQSIGYLTPAQAHIKEGQLAKAWKSNYKKHKMTDA
jgi:transposase InsO family protein/predicted DNA-binding protein YlxM (UPF0122 family)